MAKCKRCGKKGFFLKLNKDGICADCERLVSLETQEKEAQARLDKLNSDLSDQDRLYQQLLERAKEDALKDAKADLEEVNKLISQAGDLYQDQQNKLQEATALEEKSRKTYDSNSRKAKTLQEKIKSMQYAIETYFDTAISDNAIRMPSINEDLETLLSPSVNLKLHCMDVKQLRKRFNDNQKIIKETLEKYQSRYTTKANMTIYQLMVMALEAELQNILYNIGFGKIDDALNDVKKMTEKYLTIVSNGNQSIAPTVVKFIGEIEYLFLEAVKIEYEYYVQKERIKDEQRALREQMRQEAEERKILEQQKKQIEKEESKYQNEISSIEEQMAQTQDDQRVADLQKRLAELQEQLNGVEDKKEEIVKRQNGQAGYVYIISNIGSFGDDVFKVGMTRRIDPQDRVNELGDASVPFPFDVHSFIFSDDAVALESNMHRILNNKRVNKVNLRKEFFHVSLDELENLVYRLQPSAEFNRTALAEQYQQSLSIVDVPAEDIVYADDDDKNLIVV